MGEQYDDEFSGYVDAEARRELARQEERDALQARERMGISSPVQQIYGPTRAIAEDPNSQPGPVGGYPRYLQPPVQREGALPIDRLMRGSSLQTSVTAPSVAPELTPEELAAASNPDPTGTPIATRPAPRISWTDREGVVYKKNQGWREGVGGSDIVRSTPFAEGTPGYEKYGNALLQGRGIPVLQEEKDTRDAARESDRLKRMTPQQRYDEHMDIIEKRILSKTGIDVNRNYIEEAEQEVKERWKSAPRAARDGNFLYEKDYNSYMDDLAKAKASAAQKMAQGQQHLTRAIAGVQKNQVLSKDQTMIPGLGGGKERGVLEIPQGGTGVLIDDNKITPIPGQPSPGGKGSGAGGDGTGTENIPASQKLVSEAVKLQAFQGLLKTIRMHAAKYDDTLKEFNASIAPGSKIDPAKQAGIADRMMKADQARMFMAEMANPGGSDNVLK
jgi:hypothetical protein